MLEEEQQPQKSSDAPSDKVRVSGFCIQRSAINSREDCSVLYKNKKNNIGFNNSGLTLEFRSLVGIGRSGGMIGRCCLNMFPKFPQGSEL